MVEELELEEKKKEFHDASVEIIRLIDSGHVDSAQELYNLYTNLYYEILPSLKEDESSQYYQNLSQIYNKLKPHLVTQGDVSSANNLYKTDIDTLYEWVQEKGKVTLKDVQARFKIDKKKSDEWATILEKSGLIKIKYTFLKGVLLTKIK